MPWLEPSVDLLRLYSSELRKACFAPAALFDFAVFLIPTLADLACVDDGLLTLRKRHTSSMHSLDQTAADQVLDRLNPIVVVGKVGFLFDLPLVWERMIAGQQSQRNDPRIEIA